MHEIKAKLEDIQKLIAVGLKKVDLETKRRELGGLDLEMQGCDFWGN